VVIALGDFMKANCHACIGGTNVREDIRRLESGAHVVVGTPGRVFDMISRGALSTSQIEYLIRICANIFVNCRNELHKNLRTG
jgi:translation initiation factor 4A